MGGRCAPGDPIQDEHPLRRHPPRHRRRPQALGQPTCGCCAALFEFARAETSCWPCDNSIADRVHCHPGTIQRSLRYLEDLGYIRRQPSRENPTGRLIHLTCREPDWERPPTGHPSPKHRRWGDQPSNAGIERRHAKGDVVVEGLKTEESRNFPERSRPDPAPPPVDLPTPVAAVPLQAKVPTRVPPAPVHLSPPSLHRYRRYYAGPGRGTSGTSVPATAQGRAWASSSLPYAGNALGRVLAIATPQTPGRPRSP